MGDSVEGATSAEYGLCAGLIAAGAAVAVGQFGQAAVGLFQRLVTEMGW